MYWLNYFLQVRGRHLDRLFPRRRGIRLIETLSARDVVAIG